MWALGARRSRYLGCWTLYQRSKWVQCKKPGREHRARCVAAVAGGGKFENGAVAGAFGYLFNAMPHMLMEGNEAHILFGQYLQQQFGADNVDIRYRFSFSSMHFETDAILFGVDVLELKPATYQLDESVSRYWQARQQVAGYVTGLNANASSITY